MSGMCTETVISPRLTVIFSQEIHQMKALRKCGFLTYFSTFIFLTEISRLIFPSQIPNLFRYFKSILMEGIVSQIFYSCPSFDFI